MSDHEPQYRWDANAGRERCALCGVFRANHTDTETTEICR